jgi:putative membrane protein
MTLENKPGEPDPRLLLAAERTLLAWIRTGIAMMGFGLVVARFGLFLRELALATHGPLEGGAGSITTGVAVVGAGIGVNLWASLRHCKMAQRFHSGESAIGVTGPVAVGIATALGGALLMAPLAQTLLK